MEETIAGRWHVVLGGSKAFWRITVSNNTTTGDRELGQSFNEGPTSPCLYESLNIMLVVILFSSRKLPLLLP